MPRPRQNADRTLSRAEIQKAYRARQATERAQELAQKGMPKTRPIASMPSQERWNALLEAARAYIETAQGEMQSYFDDRSEEWQESERGETIQERLTQLETALDALNET